MSTFILSCGGTGGHLSPGIALAEQLIERGHSVTLLISQKKVDSRLIEKYPQLNFVRIPGSGFGWSPMVLARCVASQAKGFMACMKLVRDLKPGCVLGFGGFTSAPIALAAWLRGIPVALHEANRVPGKAVRTMGRIAKRIYLPPGVKLAGHPVMKIRHAGLPVRSDIVPVPREQARHSFGLHAGAPVLVVLGGSQGALPLNHWVRRELDSLLSSGLQVVCVAGLGKETEEVIERRAANGTMVKAVFMSFCDRMGELISAADLVVTRSGAGTLAELVRCKVPAILVPYPQSADDHQKANAAYFAEKGGGQVLEQTHLQALRSLVHQYVFDAERQEKARAALRHMEETNTFDLMLEDLERFASGEWKKCVTSEEIDSISDQT